jgi:hypothetical protein
VDTPRHTCCPPLIPRSIIPTPGTVDSTQNRISSSTETARELKLESPSQESDGLGSLRSSADTEEFDIFEDLLLLDPGLEFLEASVPSVSYPECFPPLGAADSWSEVDPADHHDDELSPIPDLLELEFAAFGDEYNGNGSEVSFLDLQASVVHHSRQPPVDPDALVSTPAPPDIWY